MFPCLMIVAEFLVALVINLHILPLEQRAVLSHGTDFNTEPAGRNKPFEQRFGSRGTRVLVGDPFRVIRTWDRVDRADLHTPPL